MTDARLLREALAAVRRLWETDARTRVPRQQQPVHVVTAGSFHGQ
ncbi:hypothetical protein ACL02R_16975 [Streptomyces sp. MS19]